MSYYDDWMDGGNGDLCPGWRRSQRYMGGKPRRRPCAVCGKYVAGLRQHTLVVHGREPTPAEVDAWWVAKPNRDLERIAYGTAMAKLRVAATEEQTRGKRPRAPQEFNLKKK